jgi:preprotein translocase subunit SecG
LKIKSLIILVLKLAKLNLNNLTYVKTIWISYKYFLIIIIFLRIPQENVGLASFATKSDLLGSPSSAQRSLNILTAFGILIYFGIAIQMNLTNN